MKEKKKRKKPRVKTSEITCLRLVAPPVQVISPSPKSHLGRFFQVLADGIDHNVEEIELFGELSGYGKLNAIE